MLPAILLYLLVACVVWLIGYMYVCRMLCQSTFMAVFVSVFFSLLWPISIFYILPRFKKIFSKLCIIAVVFALYVPIDKFDYDKQVLITPYEGTSCTLIDTTEGIKSKIPKDATHYSLFIYDSQLSGKRTYKRIFYKCL